MGQRLKAFKACKFGVGLQREVVKSGFPCEGMQPAKPPVTVANGASTLYLNWGWGEKMENWPGFEHMFPLKARLY